MYCTCTVTFLTSIVNKKPCFKIRKVNSNIYIYTMAHVQSHSALQLNSQAMVLAVECTLVKYCKTYTLASAFF